MKDRIVIIYINVEFNLNITIGSILGSPCTHIAIQSIGHSTYDGWYFIYIFGSYSFVSTDARGNNMYHANIQGTNRFITKNMDNYWVVNITISCIFKYMLCK